MTHPSMGGSEGVIPVIYGDHLHWVDMPPCKTCEAQNKAWDQLLAEKGTHYVTTRMTKRESFRLYDRKYPYDMASKALPLDEIENTLGDEGNFQEIMEGDEAREAFLETLTPYQKEIAELIEQGHKPRDIAEIQGRDNSGSIRWQKHNIKQRAQEYWEEQEKDRF